jgi:hypothetical protein
MATTASAGTDGTKAYLVVFSGSYALDGSYALGGNCALNHNYALSLVKSAVGRTAT